MKYMKHILIFIIAFTLSVHAQTTQQWNYIKTTLYPNGKPGTEWFIQGLASHEQPKCDTNYFITYYDGMAREIQSLTKSGSIDTVIVTNKFYDDKSRLIASSKPFKYAHNDLELLSAGTLYGTSFDGTNDMNGAASTTLNNVRPYERIIYLSESLDRVSRKLPYGNEFHNNNHFLKNSYTVQPSDKLLCSISEDENGNIQKTYTDFFSKTIRSVVIIGNDSLVTSFIYDINGNLTHTLPPRANVKSLFQFTTHNQVQLISEGAGLQSLYYIKPFYASDITVKAKITYKEVIIPREAPACDQILNIRYRTYTHGKPDAWVNMTSTGSLIIIHLNANQTGFEFQKTNYERLNTPSGCQQSDYYPELNLFDSALVPIESNYESKYVTLYKYNTQNRLIQKTSPDEGTIKYVYDKKGQLRFVQDQNHATDFTFNGQRRYWTYYKYDSLGRVIEQGEFNQNLNQDTLQTKVTTGSLVGLSSYPTSNKSETAINQYDLYAGAGWSISLTASDTADSYSKARLTRSKIFDPNANTWTEEAYTYDAYGRVKMKWIYIPELASMKNFQYFYDASGKPVKMVYQPQDANESLYQWFKYDAMGRLDTVFTNLTNSIVTAKREAVYDYDDNYGGKVKKMQLGNNIQSVDYSYTIRDWLKNINGTTLSGTDRFQMLLKYNDASENPQYNGNIAEINWQIYEQAASGYKFVYDNANRLLHANFMDNNKYSEKSLQYDANGNILSLTRHLNSSTGSALNYTYDANKPNRLNSVSGLLNATYTYDGNGNMTNDNTKGAFSYDYRNMPVKVTTNDTVIEYAYDAAGQRIKKNLKMNGNVVDQCIYIRNGSNVLAEYRNGSIDHYNIYGNGLIGKLKPFLNKAVMNAGNVNWAVTAKDTVEMRGESRLDAGGSLLAVGQAQGYGDKRYYYLSDHLGSIRVVLREDGSVESWSDYYPFGKESRGSSTSNEPKEKFTGKERDIEIGLDYFGARYYNADIGRWTSNEPYNSKYPHLSGYAYSANNPLILVDINGFEWKLSERAKNNSYFMALFNIYKESDYGKARLDYLAKADYLTYIDVLNEKESQHPGVTCQMTVEMRSVGEFIMRQIVGKIDFDEIEKETGVKEDQDLVVIYLNYNGIYYYAQSNESNLLIEALLTLNHEIEDHAIFDPSGQIGRDAAHKYWYGTQERNDYTLTGDVPGAKAARALKEIERKVMQAIKEDEERKKKEEEEKKKKEKK